jgi:hypothetical protein
MGSLWVRRGIAGEERVGDAGYHKKEGLLLGARLAAVSD